MTGEEYVESLRDDREVYLHGERVEDVTTHPAFANSIRSIAGLYDALHDGSVTTVPTDTGNGSFTHPFFKMARSAEELLESKDAIEQWARMTYGWVGRTPDYKASFLGTLGVNEDYYGEYRENAVRWYRESQEKVLYWNHAIINPPIDRHLPSDQINDVVVHVTRETDNGVVLSGAKVVATGSVATNRAFIASAVNTVKDPSFAIIAGIPMDAKGVKLISRASYAQVALQTSTPFDYPLSTRFDENDAILVLDEVEVPWEDVFLYRDVERFNTFLTPASGFASRMAFQGAIRLSVKVDFLCGLLLQALELTGAKAFRGVQSRLGEVLSYRSALHALTDQMARNPEPWKGGTVQPNSDAINAARVLGMRFYARIREVALQDLGSALIYLPSSAKDFQSDATRPYLDRYVRGSNGHDAEDRVKTLKLLWDAIGSEFGGRHELYERNYQGNHEHVPMEVFFGHEGSGKSQELIDFARSAMDDYDLDGWKVPGLQS